MSCKMSIDQSIVGGQSIWCCTTRRLCLRHLVLCLPTLSGAQLIRNRANIIDLKRRNAEIR